MHCSPRTVFHIVTALACGWCASLAGAQTGNAQIGLTVSVPNGYASVRVDDLRLSSSAGPVRWLRQWDGKEWQFNPHWEACRKAGPI